MERKEREARLRHLKAAMLRVAKGRPKDSRNCKMSISSIAREAGVSASLVHNCYPEILAEIRRRSANGTAIQAEPARSSREGEIAELRRKVAQLASINETLLAEVRVLRAHLENGKGSAVVSIAGRRRARASEKPEADR